MVLWMMPRRAAVARGSGGFSELKWVAVDDDRQLVLTRGASRSLPVVLFLHGGPGVSAMPAASELHGALEPHVVMAHWDQPGTATACLGSDDTLSITEVVDSAERIAEHLRAEFQVERIGLIGASWGSVVGLLLAQRRPDLVWAYVGEGQVLNTGEGEVEALEHVRSVLTAAGDTDALHELSELRAPFDRPEDVGRLRLALAREGAVWRDGPAILRAAGWMAWGREHTAREKLMVLPCTARAAAALSGEIKSLRLDKSISQTQTPTFIFQGRHDYLAPPGVVASWSATVGGQGAQVVWFERSGHFPSLEEPDRYLVSFKELVLPHGIGFGGGGALPAVPDPDSL